MKKLGILGLALILAAAIVAVGCGSGSSGGAAAGESNVKGIYANLDPARTYYLCSSHQAHTYFTDSHIGLRYAAEYFNVRIVASGPDAWDTQAQAQAIEQAISRQPAGIITRMWDNSPLDAIRQATRAGIPVVVTETRMGETQDDIGGALTYIGLNNFDCGRDTARELVKQSGTTSGTLVLMGNWGASNTDAKRAGVKSWLAENAPGWRIIAEVDDQADTAAAIEAGKAIINNYASRATGAIGIIGLDSSSGTGISQAMEELNVPAGSATIVVHDREPSTLDYIEKGYISATLINKTATDEYMAILLMEDWNNGGIKNVPISSDNAAAGITAVPDNMYVTAFAITKDNVRYFKADVMPDTRTSLYNR
ncbi:MAG: substrate-binding domain-containing protein [Treponema sp.]|jgi:ribose transport system substrate-binding protein|nr:substrate-binding domain-containing protein [Treponema sp.]